jgi:hypothetical protein
MGAGTAVKLKVSEPENPFALLIVSLTTPWGSSASSLSWLVLVPSKTESRIALRTGDALNAMGIVVWPGGSKKTWGFASAKFPAEFGVKISTIRGWSRGPLKVQTTVPLIVAVMEFNVPGWID